MLFEDLGLKYLGPIDGHDEQATESALSRAREFGGPVLVHVITQKGRGYALAEENDEDCLHQVSPGAAVHLNGTPVKKPSSNGGAASFDCTVAKRPYTKIFADEMAAIGARRPDVVAITAAMLHPTGLNVFADSYPGANLRRRHRRAARGDQRGGLAMGGMHPVVAVYSTFLNRAFDQVLMDVAMHKLPVTFVLDRAGVTGPDGASHHGMWDGSILQIVPGMKIAVPRDGTRLVELLRECVAVGDGPTTLQVPRQVDAAGHRRPSATSAAWTCSPSRPTGWAPTYCWSPPGRWPRRRSTWPAG